MTIEKQLVKYYLNIKIIKKYLNCVLINLYRKLNRINTKSIIEAKVSFCNINSKFNCKIKNKMGLKELVFAASQLHFYHNTTHIPSLATKVFLRHLPASERTLIPPPPKSIHQMSRLLNLEPITATAKNNNTAPCRNELFMEKLIIRCQSLVACHRR